MKDLHGVRAEDVIAAIQRRAESHRAGDAAPDGLRLGLVIEGGALRGVCSAGGAVALAQLGYSNIFDEVYATSAAVMNASYFLTNQPLLGISVYFDNCTTRKFVNPLRVWKIVDVDYIFDHVVVREKPLDLRRLVQSRSSLFVAVTDRETGEPVVIDVKASGTQMLTVMKASSAMPVFYNRAVAVDGRPCVDGGLVMPFALAPALSNGCTHVLVLSTRPAEYLAGPPSRWSRFVFNTLFARGSQRLNQVYAEQHLRSRETRATALGQRVVPDTVHIATVCTSGVENVHRMHATRDDLHSAAESYGRKVVGLFAKNAHQWNLPRACGTAKERHFPAS